MEQEPALCAMDIDMAQLAINQTQRLVNVLLRKHDRERELVSGLQFHVVRLKIVIHPRFTAMNNVVRLMRMRRLALLKES